MLLTLRHTDVTEALSLGLFKQRCSAVCGSILVSVILCISKDQRLRVTVKFSSLDNVFMSCLCHGLTAKSLT